MSSTGLFIGAWRRVVYRGLVARMFTGTWTSSVTTPTTVPLFLPATINCFKVFRDGAALGDPPYSITELWQAYLLQVFCRDSELLWVPEFSSYSPSSSSSAALHSSATSHLSIFSNGTIVDSRCHRVQLHNQSSRSPLKQFRMKTYACAPLGKKWETCRDTPAAQTCQWTPSKVNSEEMEINENDIRH